MARYLGPAVLLVFGVLCGVARAQSDEPDQQAPLPDLRPRELLAVLQEPIETADFRAPMTLKDALQKITARLAARGKRVPVQIDKDGFKEEAPDADDPFDTQVLLPTAQRRLPLHRALTLLAAQIPTNNGTFRLRPGCIEITTNERTAPAFMLRQRVTASFEARPFGEILETLFDLTGVAVIVDARYAYRLRTVISAKLTNNITLEDALRILSDMADLHPVVVGNQIYLTSPANARRWRQESQGEIEPWRHSEFQSKRASAA